MRFCKGKISSPILRSSVVKQKSRSIDLLFCFGAGNQNRTDDLVITNDVLYRLSHTSDLVIISKKKAFVKHISKLSFIFFEKIYFFLDFIVFSCYTIHRETLWSEVVREFLRSENGRLVWVRRVSPRSRPLAVRVKMLLCSSQRLLRYSFWECALLCLFFAQSANSGGTAFSTSWCFSGRVIFLVNNLWRT